MTTETEAFLQWREAVVSALAMMARRGQQVSDNHRHRREWLLALQHERFSAGLKAAADILQTVSPPTFVEKPPTKPMMPKKEEPSVQTERIGLVLDHTYARVFAGLLMLGFRMMHSYILIGEQQKEHGPVEELITAHNYLHIAKRLDDMLPSLIVQTLFVLSAPTQPGKLGVPVEDLLRVSRIVLRNSERIINQTFAQAWDSLVINPSGLPDDLFPSI